MKSGDAELSSRLRSISSELRAINRQLKAGKVTPGKTVLQEFRQILDNVRMTAWTVSELINARESTTNPEPLLSFLASERMRRVSQMMRDLSADIDKQAFTWQSSGIQALSNSVRDLDSRLTKLSARTGPTGS
jgi:hypothetical protein